MVSDRESMEFLERLCGYSWPTEIWFTLYKGGGAFRFTELLRHVECQRQALSRSLVLLLTHGLVIKRGPKYQAVRPPWSAP